MIITCKYKPCNIYWNNQHKELSDYERRIFIKSVLKNSTNLYTLIKHVNTGTTKNYDDFKNTFEVLIK